LAVLLLTTCSIGPEVAAENTKILKSVGVTYLDSPVSGLRFRAEEGALVSMIAGNADALECARPLI
jgi:3-hydroxyisobutyrate dehydrogenase-like beta-hydroxyacid dehydrogenase